ncbi:chromosomal replication initiator protein DnaA [bacterium]|nr:chromosomal replication initiator protein DnaA [bacterium]
MTQPAFQSSEHPQMVWQKISTILQDIIPPQSYLTWFKPIEALAYDQKTLTLRIPSQFCHDWIESHYHDPLHQAVKDVLGENIVVMYDINPGKPQIISERIAYREKSAPTSDYTSTLSISASYTHLNPRYRFSNFIEGDCNSFARAAALSLAETPGKNPFNPLLIYGGSGLGKTHLMQAIGNRAVELGRVKKVLYVTSEQFTSDFIKGIQDGKKDVFIKNYRNVDLLLLDDVQFFMTKEKTQEEFFHTFNSLHQVGKLLVFSSDRPPNELNGFDKRLVSRLQWGLVAEVQKPEYETRLAILKNLSKENGIDISDDIAHFLSVHISTNIRSLQSALIQLLAQSSLMGREITLDLAREAIKKQHNQPSYTISVDQIQEMVAREMDIPSDLIRSKTRKKEVVRARHIAMYLTTEYTILTQKTIGLHFGGRNHATVIHAVKVVNELIENNVKVREMIAKIRRDIDIALI